MDEALIGRHLARRDPIEQPVDLGEIRRRRDDAEGYGPRGKNFIDHVDIPAPVLAADERLAAEHPHRVRG